MSALTRRKALKLLAGIGAVSLLPATRWAVARGLPGNLARFSENLEVRAAARLGSDYLAIRPEESDVGVLLEQITADDAATPESLAARVRSDFAAGRVVELRDWQVSLTEARIFALLAMSV